MTACVIVSPFSITADSLPGGTHFIVGDVRLEPLSDTHKLRIIDYLDGLEEEPLSRLVRTKPAFIVPYSEVGFLKGVGDPNQRNLLTLDLHRFTLEHFAERAVPMAAFSYDGESVVAHKVDQDVNRFREADAIKLPEGSWEKHVAYLKYVYPTLARAPAADIVISRICRAFRAGPTTDGIIDLAIALEALVEAKLEIKYQFALFDSLINVSSTDERLRLFTSLQLLYDVRSLSIHGGKPGTSDKRKIDNIVLQWPDLLKLARENLTYYVEYCRSNPAKDWPSHLKGIALGNPRIQSGNEDDQD